MIDTLATLSPESTLTMTKSIVNLFAGIYAGIMGVVVPRDCNNQKSTDKLPPVLPHSLAAIRTNELCEMIQPYCV